MSYTSEIPKGTKKAINRTQREAEGAKRDPQVNAKLPLRAFLGPKGFLFETQNGPCRALLGTKMDLSKRSFCKGFKTNASKSHLQAVLGSPWAELGATWGQLGPTLESTRAT